MSRVYVSFEVEVPANATEDEIEEWLRFSFRDGCSMDMENPLSEYEPEPVFGTFDWRLR